jgi:hypothetical protein
LRSLKPGSEYHRTTNPAPGGESLRFRKEPLPFPAMVAGKRQTGAGAMSPHVLDAVIWLFGMRGPDRPGGDFPVGPRGSSPTASANWLRMLAAWLVAIVFLSLVLWGAVRLALKLL